jgi:hypothetical protein
LLYRHPGRHDLAGQHHTADGGTIAFTSDSTSLALGDTDDTIEVLVCTQVGRPADPVEHVR